MNSFPLTAPRFTDAQAEEERNNLTPEERAAIEHDAYGRGASSIVTEIDSTMAREQIQQAMEFVETSERQAYDRALEVVPELVHSESNAVHFLRCCHQDQWAAAKRLANYWEARARVFGENAFRPLKSTGNDGALSRDAIEILESCFWTRLKDDAMKRAVIFVDRSRIRNTSGRRSAFLEVIFYVVSNVARESEYAQQNGIVFILDCRSDSRGQFDRRLLKGVVGLIGGEVFPCNAKALHCCGMNLPPPLPLVLPVGRFIIGKYLRTRLFLHYGSPGLLVTSLGRFGLTRGQLPTGVGGDLNVMESHRSWLEGCRTRE